MPLPRSPVQSNAGGDTLNKIKIGDYLGENETFNKDVLASFAQQHNFRGLAFDKALRWGEWRCVSNIHVAQVVLVEFPAARRGAED